MRRHCGSRQLVSSSDQLASVVVYSVWAPSVWLKWPRLSAQPYPIWLIAAGAQYDKRHLRT